MFCPKCGTKNEDTAKFCAACGAPLRSGQPTAANASASVTQAGPRSQANLKNATTFIAGHRIKLIAITAVAVVAIAGVVLFNLLGKSMPPQGSFVFSWGFGMYIDGDNITITAVDLDGSESDVGSGAFVKEGSYDGGTIWKGSISGSDLDAEAYIQIPDAALEGDVEGTWTLVLVLVDAETGESQYTSARYQFNDDGTLYIDNVAGTNPKANLIENQTPHDNVEDLEDVEGIERAAAWHTTWREIADGKYSFTILGNDYAVTIDPTD